MTRWVGRTEGADNVVSISGDQAHYNNGEEAIEGAQGVAGLGERQHTETDLGFSEENRGCEGGARVSVRLC